MLPWLDLGQIQESQRSEKVPRLGIAYSKPVLAETASSGSRVNIVNVTSAELLRSFDLPKTVCLEFSPKNSVLATWQAYTSEYLPSCRRTRGNRAVQYGLRCSPCPICHCGVFSGRMGSTERAQKVVWVIR